MLETCGSAREGAYLPEWSMEIPARPLPVRAYRGTRRYRTRPGEPAARAETEGAERGDPAVAAVAAVADQERGIPAVPTVAGAAVVGAPAVTAGPTVPNKIAPDAPPAPP